MELQTAIEIVESHQAWRLGADTEMVTPKKLTEALNVVLKHAKEGIEVSSKKG